MFSIARARPGRTDHRVRPRQLCRVVRRDSAGCCLSSPDGLFGHIGGSATVPTPAGYGPDEPIVKFAAVTDGLSNTAAFSERCYGLGTGNNNGYQAKTPTATSVAV